MIRTNDFAMGKYHDKNHRGGSIFFVLVISFILDNTIWQE